MSYPFGAEFHVPHGEANHLFLSAMMRVYQQKDPDGAIRELNLFLQELFSQILSKKPLHAYGAAEEQLHAFTDNVMEKQGRLMANACVPLDRETVYQIYRAVY